MKFLIETVLWLIVTTIFTTWIWGLNPVSLIFSLVLSLTLSLIGGNVLYNRDTWR